MHHVVGFSFGKCESNVALGSLIVISLLGLLHLRNLHVLLLDSQWGNIEAAVAPFVPILAWYGLVLNSGVSQKFKPRKAVSDFFLVKNCHFQ